MYKQRVSTLESPRVEVTACQGNLTIVTWDDAEVQIKVDSEEVLTVEERDGTVALAANSDCHLTIPTNASLNVIQVQGDLAVQGVSGTVEVVNVQGKAKFRGGTASASLGTAQGDLAVEGWTGSFDVGTIQGDARMRQVNGSADFGTVGGDLLAEGVNGPLSAQSVMGDAYLRQVNGPLSLGDVNADLIGRVWTAGADVAGVGGDVSLKSVFAGPHTYRIQARGNISVQALPGSDATFTLQADSGRIKAKGLAGDMAEEGQWQGAVGDGRAQVSLTSTHGNVTLKAVGEGEEAREYTAFSPEMPLPPIPPEIPMPPTVPAQELAWRIQQRVAEKLSKIDFEAIAQREAERARRQAERELAKAQRTAERARLKAERVQKKARERGRRWHFEWDSEHGARRTPRRSQGVSEEERLAVLQMLAEGKISAQEAETLLGALEG